MCIQNAQKVKKTDRSKYKIAYKVTNARAYPICYPGNVSKPFHLDGKWNKVKRISENKNPNSMGFHLFLRKKDADKWWNLDTNHETHKCEIRGVLFIGKTNAAFGLLSTVISTQFRVVS